MTQTSDILELKRRLALVGSSGVWVQTHGDYMWEATVEATDDGPTWRVQAEAEEPCGPAVIARKLADAAVALAVAELEGGRRPLQSVNSLLTAADNLEATITVDVQVAGS